MRKIFVTGIGTDVGKTVVSSVLAEGLNADYWKPIQTGAAFGSDSDKVRRLVTNGVSVVHPEAYKFDAYMAPNSAATATGKHIDFDSIKLPETNKTLIIEGAGGLLVPITEKHFMVDLIKKLEAEVILVSQNYLGNINHTLLSCEALRSRGIKVLGLIITGTENVASEEIILKHSGYPMLGRINREASITPEVIKKYASYFAGRLK
ncbi:MAG TPA: dethiobiotin synthase [Bacteroidia bacterium]|jgi:dethiobiotin synthetase|nr:dethiobiotin synthase [Bacteroidia bacterium]